MSEAEKAADSIDSRFEKLRADFDRHIKLERQYSKDNLEHLSKTLRLSVDQGLENTNWRLQKKLMLWATALSGAILALWGFTTVFEIPGKARAVWDEKVGKDIVETATKNSATIQQSLKEANVAHGAIVKKKNEIESMHREVAGATVPIGTILAWWGDPKGTLPPGFELCDGSNPEPGDTFQFRKPDLKGKFLKGAGLDFIAEVAVAKGSEFTATAKTSEHSLSIPEIPYHRHEIVFGLKGGKGTNPLQSTDEETTAGKENGHTQPIGGPKPEGDESKALGKGHAHEIPALKIDPPHYEVVFIIRVK